MALTGTDRGTGSHNTTATTLAVVPASNLAAGSTAVLVVAADNTGASGAYSITTATDTKGNTWTRQQSPLYDPGAAAAGVQGAIFTTPQNGGALTTGDTITVTFSVTTVAKAWTLMEVAPASGFAVRYISGGVNAGAASAAPTVTTGSITSANMVIGGLFNEYGTAQVVTGDADSTNGSWSAQQTIDVGLTTSGVGVSSQRKVVTATATQTYNPTLLTSSDVILAWIELAQVEVPACYSAAVRADSPVAYWRLGEASGTNAKDAIGTADGTYTGGITLGAASLLSGDTNTSADLNGSTGYVTVPDVAGFSLVATGQLSLEALISPDAIPNNLSFIHKGAAAQYEYNLALLSSGAIRFILWDIDGNDRLTLTSTTALNDPDDLGAIVHVAVTLNDATDTARLYINGVVEDTETTWAGSSTGGTAGFVIGRRDDSGTEFFDGRIDEVAIYSVALTPTQVLVHYEARIASCVPRFTPYPQILAH